MFIYFPARIVLWSFLIVLYFSFNRNKNSRFLLLFCYKTVINTLGYVTKNMKTNIGNHNFSRLFVKNGAITMTMTIGLREHVLLWFLYHFLTFVNAFALSFRAMGLENAHALLQFIYFFCIFLFLSVRHLQYVWTEEEELEKWPSKFFLSIFDIILLLNGEYECCSVRMDLPAIFWSWQEEIFNLFICFQTFLSIELDSSTSPMGIQNRLISVVTKNLRVKAFVSFVLFSFSSPID